MEYIVFRPRSARSRLNKKRRYFIKSLDIFIIRHMVWNLIYRCIRVLLGASILEDYIRIPVSLKFDKNSSFYREFVAPKRESRELSEFIVNLMRVYYENDRLRVALDEAIDELTPFGKIKKQLERIHLEHSKVLMTTAVLSSQVSQMIDKVENAIHDEDKPRLPPVVRETPALLERILKLEQILPSLDAKLDAVLSTLQNGVKVSANEALPVGGNQQEKASAEGSGVFGKTDSINSGNETSNNFASIDSNHEIVIDSSTKNDEISASKEELVDEEKGAPIVLPSTAPVIGEEDGGDQKESQESDSSSSVQNQEGKPRVASANFGKLLKSVKKK